MVRSALSSMIWVVVIPHLMRNPFLTIWIPAFAGMTAHQSTFDRAIVCELRAANYEILKGQITNGKKINSQQSSS